jgi:carbon-monoxide dehydrogenase large subunit
VPFDSVRLVTGDTDRVSVGGGAHSGRALRMGSVVMMNASRDIVAQARRIAGPLLNADPDTLSFAGGRFGVPGTGRSMDLFDVAAASNEALTAVSDEVFNIASFPYGSHVCEVEVDPETGVVDIVNYAAVDDVGRAVNPMIVHGQVHGGIVQGAGQALLEQCVYDPKTGQMLSASFMDYAMPRADRFPFFRTALSEVPSPTHPLGIRPGGEGGTTPALGVVINAIVDALSDYGVTHIEMPATPERVWNAINGR